ncbi:MAG: sigma-70 family RNA polymerase sigma factor [Pirellulaceae bacterium]|nr:sigma-70 family RNA polymerase sigma factor [Pirellulaceae bacterium]
MNDREFEKRLLAMHPEFQARAFSLMRNHADADDLLQNAYLAAFKGWRTYDETRGPLLPWFATILRHCAGRMFSQVRRTPSLGDDEVLALDDEKQFRQFLAKTGQANEAEMIEKRVKGAIACLDVNDQFILTSRWKGTSHQAIAEQLNITADDSRKRLERAITKLRKIIDIGERASYDESA